MKIGMLFPGYGSQFVGMGKELYDESRIMQEFFEEASNCLDINFVKLCFASSDVELSAMHHAYTATFLISCSIFAMLKEQGIQPTMVTGYDLGEYSALFASGCFSFPDGLYLLNKFATFYQEALHDMEVATLQVNGISAKELDTLCAAATDGDTQVQVGLYNTETSHIVSGHVPAIQRLRDLAAQKEGVSFDDASVEVGLHSPLMEPVAQAFRMYLEKVDFKDLSAPLINNIDAQPMVKGDEVKESLIKDISDPVQWVKVMDKLSECDLLIEIGPGTKLSSMMQQRHPDNKIIALNKPEDLSELKTLVPTQESEESTQNVD